MYLYLSLTIYIYIYICNIHIYIYIYIHTHINHIYIYIYIYTHTHTHIARQLTHGRACCVASLTRVCGRGDAPKRLRTAAQHTGHAAIQGPARPALHVMRAPRRECCRVHLPREQYIQQLSEKTAHGCVGRAVTPRRLGVMLRMIPTKTSKPRKYDII